MQQVYGVVTPDSVLRELTGKAIAHENSRESTCGEALLSNAQWAIREVCAKKVCVACVLKPQVTYLYTAQNELLGPPLHECIVVFAVSIF